MITNTHAVGTVHRGVIEWVKQNFPEAAMEWLLPVVAETWDGYLNDINGAHVTTEHAISAIDTATGGVRSLTSMIGKAGEVIGETLASVNDKVLNYIGFTSMNKNTVNGALDLTKTNLTDSRSFTEKLATALSNLPKTVTTYIDIVTRYRTEGSGAAAGASSSQSKSSGGQSKKQWYE
jgi:hypothetical protein